MMGNFKGNLEPRFVLITGCSSGGIGHALSREFANQGYVVISTVRNAGSAGNLTDLDFTSTVSLDKYSEAGQQLRIDWRRGDFQGKAAPIYLLYADVSSCESIDLLFEQVSRLTRGKLHILVNNAGSNYTVPALHSNIEQDVRKMFETNLFGLMRMTIKFTPLLRAEVLPRHLRLSQKSPLIRLLLTLLPRFRIDDRPQLVQIGSVAGLTPFVFGSAYNCSKAAVHSYTDCLNLELEPLGIRVRLVITGGVKSNIARTQRSLPDQSPYSSISEVYEQRVQHSQQNGIPASIFAKNVVRDILKDERSSFSLFPLLSTGHRSWIWNGGRSSIVWFLYTFTPREVLDSTMRYLFSLNRISSH